MGFHITRARCRFVARHHEGVLCDVGIGSGAFVETRRERFKQPTFGWDVNKAAMEWLNARGLLSDPHLRPQEALSLWDVLEHIPDFRSLVAQVRTGGYVFTSLPIFTDREHVLRSKHFRRDEHCWYFTADGLINTFAALGFECVEENREEVELGREDIGGFAFRRVEEQAP